MGCTFEFISPNAIVLQFRKADLWFHIQGAVFTKALKIFALSKFKENKKVGSFVMLGHLLFNPFVLVTSGITGAGAYADRGRRFEVVGFCECEHLPELVLSRQFRRAPVSQARSHHKT
jgi:hypothetical protein